ncbi:MAG: hypothetical protein ACU836_03865 [Gammaproteobacteria bacterium]
MKKLLVPVFALAMLSSSVAFADTSKLSAFEGVETAAVSTAELDQVSGEGLLNTLLGTVIGGILNDVKTTLVSLGLLNGLALDANASVTTGALLSGLTGINQVNAAVSIH